MRYLIGLFIVLFALPAWAKCHTGQNIVVRCTDTSAQSYVILGEVEASDSDIHEVRCRMLESAAKHRADAVLNYDVTMDGSRTSTARGIAVRYTKPGERGMYYVPSKSYQKLP